MVVGDQEDFDYALSFAGGTVAVALFSKGEGDLFEGIKTTMIDNGAAQVSIERSLFSTDAGRWSAVKSKHEVKGTVYDWIRLVGEGTDGRIAVLDLYVDDSIGEKYYSVIKEMAKSFTVIEPTVSSN